MKKLIMAISILALNGCATIVDGGPDMINITTSDGNKAKARIISKKGAQTVFLPTLFAAKKSCRDITVQIIEDDSTKQSTSFIDSEVNVWVFGNIIFGGLIGLGIDAFTGKICTYDNDAIIPIDRK